MLNKVERTSLMAASLVIGTWFLALVALSLSGLLKIWPPMLLGTLILLWIAIPTVSYFRSSGLQQLASRLGLRAITAFHGWRILAGIWFVWYAAHGLIPSDFALKAGWGDIVAGLAGLMVAAFWARPSGYWTAHVIGLADFVLAVGTGMATMLIDQPGMHVMAELPGALIPLFAVGLTASTHFIAFHLLWKQHRVDAGAGLLRKAEVA
jgi:hypothetical protein